MLAQQGGPQAITSMKSYFAANPKVAADMASIAQPMTNVSTQCKLPISIPQAMGLMQQGGGGLPGGPPALPPAGAGASPVSAGLGNTPTPAPAPPTPGGALPGPPRQNNVG